MEVLTTDAFLSDRVNNMEESATILMSQKARDLASRGIDVISLSLGEPDFDTPDHIKEAAKNALTEGYTKYTPVPGLLGLRQAICDKFKRDNDLEFTTSQIVVSNGAKQSIANVALALLNPGDEVVIFAPYWVSYAAIVKFAEGKPVYVSAGIDTDFKVTPDQLEKAITDKTKLVLFSSPCNPTGSVYTKEELTSLANVIARHEGVFILSDEIYEYINFTDQHASIGSFANVKDRTITVNGFSKGFAMTGWRLGYIGAPEWIAKACTKIQSQFTSGATAFGQQAATLALNSGLSATHEMKEAFLKRRDIVIELLKEIPGFKVNQPQGAFYIFPDVSAYFGKSFEGKVINNSTDFCLFLLNTAHVSVVTGEAFGAPGCFRLSYAASEKSLREAVSRIKKALSQLL